MMSFDIHPIFQFAAVTLLGAAVCLVCACMAKRWLVRGVLIVVALLFLSPSGLVLVLVKPELADGRFRTYKRLYGEIQTGMTRSEVMQTVNRHYPSGGARLPPDVMEDTSTRLGFFMNPEDSREPNCEGIFLKMYQDRVVSKTYSRD